MVPEWCGRFIASWYWCFRGYWVLGYKGLPQDLGIRDFVLCPGPALVHFGPLFLELLAHFFQALSPGNVPKEAWYLRNNKYGSSSPSTALSVEEEPSSQKQGRALASTLRAEAGSLGEGRLYEVRLGGSSVPSLSHLPLDTSVTM